MKKQDKEKARKIIEKWIEENPEKFGVIYLSDLRKLYDKKQA